MDEHKELEKLMDKIFDADQLDLPYTDFTAQVLQRIEAQQKEKLTYRPLLPKWVFFGIVVLVMAFVYIVFEFTDTSMSQVDYFESIDFSSSWITENLATLNFSNSLMYGVLALGLFICIQAKLLNRSINRTGSLA